MICVIFNRIITEKRKGELQLYRSFPSIREDPLSLPWVFPALGFSHVKSPCSVFWIFCVHNFRPYIKINSSMLASLLKIHLVDLCISSLVSMVGPKAKLDSHSSCNAHVGAGRSQSILEHPYIIYGKLCKPSWRLTKRLYLQGQRNPTHAKNLPLLISNGIWGQEI